MLNRICIHKHSTEVNSRILAARRDGNRGNRKGGVRRDHHPFSENAVASVVFTASYSSLSFCCKNDRRDGQTRFVSYRTQACSRHAA